MSHFFNDIYEELLAGRDVCLATIVKHVGSAPRTSGARMAIRADGSTRGTIGGGKLEAEVTQAAQTALRQQKTELVFFSLRGKDVSDSDMLCGGDVQVYLEPLLAADQSALELFASAAKVSTRGGTGVMITPIKPGPTPSMTGRKLFVSLGAEPAGSIAQDSELAEKLLPNLTEVAKKRPFGLHDLEIPEAETVTCLWEAVTSEPTVYLFGGGHVSLAVAKLVKMVGFRLVVMDDRQEYANRERFPEADAIWVRDYRQALKNQKLGDGDYVVIVTRGHLFDKEVLAQALEHSATYVGMIGSSRKRRAIYQALLSEGFSQERLAWVHSPIGLSIGAETPEEIAVSIVAELVAVRAGVTVKR